MDTDSESAGTNSESNSNEDTSNNIFDEEDVDMQQTIADNTEIADTADITECDKNSNHEHINDIYKQTRPKAPQRKISRLASAI